MTSKNTSIAIGIALFTGWLIIIAAIGFVDSSQQEDVSVANAGSDFEIIPVVHND